MSSRAIPTFFLLSALLLSSCALPGGETSAPEPAQRQFFAMNTLMTIQITGDAKEIAALVLAIQERQIDEACIVETITDCTGSAIRHRIL